MDVSPVPDAKIDIRHKSVVLSSASRVRDVILVLEKGQLYNSLKIKKSLWENAFQCNTQNILGENVRVRRIMVWMPSRV